VVQPQQALRWAEQYCSTDTIERLFGEQPEAGDAEAKLTLRMPEVRRQQLAALADANIQSLNAWIVRCLEGCAQVSVKR
jgi:predicted HicB family RNase H-like nuclease